MKRERMTGILFLAGFFLCCFPVINNVVEQRNQKKAVATYQREAQRKENHTKMLLKEARQYNDCLYRMQNADTDSTNAQTEKDESYEKLKDENYEKMLDITGTGIMGSLDIPKIDVKLPIYHGTSEEALSNGIGHLQGTSLPAGGENTNSILTGHRGLPSSKLLVRLDEMIRGDLFFIHIGKETLAYRVAELQVVKPEDESCLQIQAGKDIVSLITCTPYGINTHRLIVTGERVDYIEEQYDEIQAAIPSVREILFTVLPLIFAAVFIGLFIRNRRHLKYAKRKKKQRKQKRKKGGAAFCGDNLHGSRCRNSRGQNDRKRCVRSRRQQACGTGYDR